MDKQQFDHIEHKIRQAADAISVPFNEEAWTRMEIKLDKEFNKGRRRGFIWWWFSFMMIGIAALGVYIYNSGSHSSGQKISEKPIFNTAQSKIAKEEYKNNRSTSELQTDDRKDLTSTRRSNIPVTENQLADMAGSPKAAQQNLSDSANDGKFNHPSQKANQENSPGEITSSTAKQRVDTAVLIPLSKQNHKASGLSFQKKPFKKAAIGKASQGAGSLQTSQEIRKTKGLGNERALPGLDDSNKGKLVDITNNNTHKDIGQSGVIDGSSSLPKPPGDSSSVMVSSQTSKPKILNTETESINKKDTLVGMDSMGKKSPTVKPGTTPSRGFYFLASIAGEATGIKEISIADTRPIYGLGIGYRFNKKLSLQTGFYFGKKVYYAGADDYKVKPGSYIAKFISAEAECYIYDIPLNVRYDAIRKNSSNLYLIAGLSSYILKRETYDMHFYNPMGTYRHLPYTYKNNVGYLSVLNFSLGYEHKLSNTLFIQAEPYLKLPLGGLGEGDAKLFSAGLQLGIKYQPLKKKR